MDLQTLVWVLAPGLRVSTAGRMGAHHQPALKSGAVSLDPPLLDPPQRLGSRSVLASLPPPPLAAPTQWTTQGPGTWGWPAVMLPGHPLMRTTLAKQWLPGPAGSADQAVLYGHSLENKLVVLPHHTQERTTGERALDQGRSLCLHLGRSQPHAVQGKGLRERAPCSPAASQDSREAVLWSQAQQTAHTAPWWPGSVPAGNEPHSLQRPRTFKQENQLYKYNSSRVQRLTPVIPAT